MAAAAVRAIGSSLSKNLREIRLQFCQSGAASQGARDFVQQHYMTLKKANPEFPILIRECSGVQPRLWARYGALMSSGADVEEKFRALCENHMLYGCDAFGKEQSVPLDNMSADQVAKAVQNAVSAKA